MARFLITGGTGFIGGALLPQLVENGHQAMVLTRHPARHEGRYGDAVSFVTAFDEIGNGEYFAAVINLAGEGIADKRWSDKRKQQLLDSRIGVTQALVALIQRLETPPKVMISGSATGWYGASDATPLDEEAEYHDEFAHELCRRWEEAAAPVREPGVRLCLVRLGVVMGNGGMLKRLLMPFKLCLGGRLGHGEQMLSWIHLRDVIKGFIFLIDNESLEGVFNLTAPTAVTNAEFTRTLGRAVSRPTPFPMPAFMVKLLFGEMGERLLLAGQNVVPARLKAAGFEFEFPRLQEALEDIVSR